MLVAKARQTGASSWWGLHDGSPFCCDGDGLVRARVLLADDHEAFLAATARFLEPEFDVVETVGNGQMLVEEVPRLDPDLLVVDIAMPVLNGIEAARQLRAAGSRAKIVFLTVHADEDYVRAAQDAGALGYVVKSRLASDLAPALREALAGRAFVSPSTERPS
jgi:DNA-binding NarL/FixJ family response regulator